MSDSAQLVKVERIQAEPLILVFEPDSGDERKLSRALASHPAWMNVEEFGAPAKKRAPAKRKAAAKKKAPAKRKAAAKKRATARKRPSALRSLFGGSEVRFEVEREKEVTQRLPLIRLHCPRAVGCSAHYERAGSSSSAAKMKIQLPGVSGGAGLKVTMTNVEGLTADGDCVQQTHRARLQMQWGTTYVDGRAFSEGLRVNVLEVDEGVKVSSIPRKQDQCQWKMADVNEAQESAQRADLRPFYDLRGLRQGKGAVDLAIAWGKESVFSAEVGGEFSAFGVNVGLSLEVEQESNVKLQLSYKLAPGGSYHPYHPSGVRQTELCWKTVKRRRGKST